MNKQLITILVILILIVSILLINNHYSKKETFNNSLYKYDKINLGEDLGFGMFGGNDEVFVYKISPAPIVGPYDVQQKQNTKMDLPQIGFKASEVEKIPDFKDAIIKKNNVTYVDNNLMVPYLYHVIKRLTITIESMYEQINDCCISK